MMAHPRQRRRPTDFPARACARTPLGWDDRRHDTTVVRDSAPRRDLVSNRDRVELDSCGIGFVAHTSGRPSREIVDLALTGLACVKHRAAIAADGLSGDGAGLLVPIPRTFVARVGSEAAGRDIAEASLGVVSAFVRPDDAARRAMEAIVEEVCTAEGIEVVAWRDVPIDPSHIGEQATADLPIMRHAIMQRPEGADDSAADRLAYRARRAAELRLGETGLDAYFASWGFETMTYKALVISDRLAGFYPDLAATDFIAPFGIFHSRFSTNTMPAWERAQPFRLLCHNGEINTVEGNVNRMVARGVLGTEHAGLGDEALFRPLFDPRDSDSGKLDCAIELLLRGGRDIRHAVAMSVPEAWEGLRDLAPGVRDFFRYHACLSDPWDGPAGLVFTDGRRVGASLDRNGLRPMRWQACEDGLVVCSSEAGAVPLAGHGSVRRGRLGPGEMLCVDPDAGGLQNDPTVKRWLAGRAPYGVWVADGLRPFASGRRLEQTPARDVLLAEQATHGLTKEELAMVLKPMASSSLVRPWVACSARSTSRAGVCSSRLPEANGRRPSATHTPYGARPASHRFTVGSFWRPPASGSTHSISPGPSRPRRTDP